MFMGFNNNFLPHISGIRAISVLIVVFFHLNEDKFSFGYLGVDIFFVISGYVISLTLYKEYLLHKNINLFNFYIKRIKRLYPSLFLCILLTLFLYFVFADLIYFSIIFKSALFSFFGISNLYYLFSNQDYFVNHLDNPFIHTWSLGIEEQFYLFFPIILSLIFFLFKFFTISIKKISYIFFTLTFLIFMFTVYNSNSIFGNFYFPLSRFWELSLGCALFFIGKINLNTYLQNILTILSAILVLLCIYYAKNISPQIQIFFICIFSSSLIIYEKSIFGKILSLPIPIFIGKISYSIYLFHFPIFFFLSPIFVGFFLYFYSLILILLVSTLNYYLIEIPFKKSKVFDSYIKVFFVIFSLIIFLLLINFYKNYNFIEFKSMVNNKINTLERNINSINLNNRKSFKFLLNATNMENYLFDNKNIRFCSSQFIKDFDYYLEYCHIKNKKNKLIHILGDSQAEHIVPMISNDNKDYDFIINAMLGATYLPNSNFYYTKDKEYKHKNKINNHYFDTSKKLIDYFEDKYQERYLVISSRFYYSIENFYFFDQDNKLVPEDKKYFYMSNILVNFINSVSPDTKIIFIPDAPTPPMSLKKCVDNLKISLPHIYSCNYNSSVFFSKRMKTFLMFKDFEKKYKNVYIFDFADYICENNTCSYFYDEYKPIYSRKNHFSIEYSNYMNDIFFNFFKNLDKN
jgi:peptidoglycan/LPS O-acetylase OafA/YrhL